MGEGGLGPKFDWITPNFLAEGRFLSSQPRKLIFKSCSGASHGLSSFSDKLSLSPDRDSSKSNWSILKMNLGLLVDGLFLKSASLHLGDLFSPLSLSQ